MNLIALDAGNTFWKIGVFIEGTLKDVKRIPRNQDCSEYINKLSREIGATQIVISSVRNSSTKEHLQNSLSLSCNWVSTTSIFPFTINYKTPETLGVDRVIACAGAFEGDDLLLIDFGSCITYDYVVEGKYLGGTISPGIQLRMKSMHDYTDNLPEVEVPKALVDIIGDSTQSCMESGVMNGVLMEVEGFISSIKKKYPKINVYLTGGDANIFADGLKSSIFVRPNIVLEGLYKIYLLNAS